MLSRLPRHWLKETICDGKQGLSSGVKLPPLKISPESHFSKRRRSVGLMGFAGVLRLRCWGGMVIVVVVQIYTFVVYIVVKTRDDYHHTPHIKEYPRTIW